MNLDRLLDPSTAVALQTAWLLDAIAPVSEPGRRSEADLLLFKPGEEGEARTRLREIYDMAWSVDAAHVDAMRDALRTLPDPVPAISRAAMGGVLEDAQFLELMRFLDAVKRIDATMEAAGQSARLLDEKSQAVASVLEHGRAGKFGFYLADRFDGSLANARSQGDKAQAEFESARGRLAQRVAAALEREDLVSGEFIVMRDAIRNLPEGIRVIREAPTYYLCELDLDDDALEALRRRDAAAEAVAAAEEAVRGHLSQAIRAQAQPLERLAEAVGEFDVLLARVRFTQQQECVVPEIVQESVVSFRDGRYLPLEAELEAQARPYEPISIELLDISVLTGPNMGGKSAALRTCGFIAALAAMGIPVPAKSARCGLFEEIAWLGIGMQEDAGGLLSSFAREVVRLKDILARPAKRMLVLIDEFARTTTPHEGKALLVALARGLRRRGRLAFIATHLGGVAVDAGARHFAVRGLRDVPKSAPAGDLRAALAALAESMDYSVAQVGDGADLHGDAIALAHLLGLDDEFVAEAAAALSEKDTEWTR